MLDPRFLGHVADGICDIWFDWETEILVDIAQRIEKADFTLSATSDWRLYKLQEMGLEKSYLTEQLARMLKKSEKEVSDLIQNTSIYGMNSEMDYIQGAVDQDFIESFSLNSSSLNKIVTDGVKATNNAVRNFTGSYIGEYSDTYEALLDKAYLQVTSGLMSPAEASKSAVLNLAKYGTTIISPAGRHENLFTVITRAVRTGVNQTALSTEMETLKEIGCNLVQVSAHVGARPSHAVWQGGIYMIEGSSDKYPNFAETTGYGTGEGLGGWNCRHSFGAYFEGLSKRSFENVDPEENKRVYDLEQQQRYNERQIRKYRRAANICASDPQEYDRYNNLRKKWTKINDNFVDAHSDVLKHDYLREVQSRELKMTLAKSGIVPTKNRYARRWTNIHDELLKNGSPGVGSIIYDEAYLNQDRTNEMKMANWLLKYFGGDIQMLTETNKNKVSTPDIIWRGKLWDFKNWEIDKESKKSTVETKVRNGLKQIKNNPGGLFIDLEKCKMDHQKVIDYILDRYRQSAEDGTELIVKDGDKLLLVVRFQK